MKYAKYLLVIVIGFLLFANTVNALGLGKKQTCGIVGEVLSMEETKDTIIVYTKIIDKKNYDDYLSKNTCDALSIGTNYNLTYELSWEQGDKVILEEGDTYTAFIIPGYSFGDIKKGNTLFISFYSYYIFKYWYIVITICAVLLAVIVILIILYQRKKLRKIKLSSQNTEEPPSN